MTGKPRSSLLSLGIVLGVAVLVSLGLSVWLRVDDSSDGRSHASVGSQLRLVDLPPLVNTSQPLTPAEVNGKVVLINYWGPWCGPCTLEMPHLIHLQRDLATETDFQLVSVSCGINVAYRNLGELQDATREFADRLNMDFPIYADPEGSSRACLPEVKKWQDVAYPTSILIDREQSIRALWIGYSPGMERDVEAAVREVVANERN